MPMILHPEVKKKSGPRGVLNCKTAGTGGQTAEDISQLNTR
jgi:hypothetical protein